jgi:putative sterol carrier protein
VDRARPPEDIRPVDFFLRWVPDAVASDPDRQQKLGDTEAVVVFDLADLDGPDGGAFTITIANGVVAAREGSVTSPDLRVFLDVGTWRQLNAGQISAPEAVLKRKLRFEGSFLLGLKLHLILG